MTERRQTSAGLHGSAASAAGALLGGVRGRHKQLDRPLHSRGLPAHGIGLRGRVLLQFGQRAEIAFQLVAIGE